LHEGGLFFARGHDGVGWRNIGRRRVLALRGHRLLSVSENPRGSGGFGISWGASWNEFRPDAKGVVPDLSGRPSSPEDCGGASRRFWLFKVGWTPTRLDNARIYHPIGVLPPDQYLAWIVQATEGCHWNRCVFCDLYRDRPARIRSRPEIRRHMEASEAYFGPAMDRRTSVFIGDADAFAAPPETLVGLCREIGRRQPRLVRPSDDGAWGIHSFAEARSVLRWPADRLRALARAGFRRATIRRGIRGRRVRTWLKSRAAPKTSVGRGQAQSRGSFRGSGLSLGGAGVKARAPIRTAR